MTHQFKMKNLLTCLIVTHCIPVVQPLRFIDRFPGHRFPVPKRCLIGLSEALRRSQTPIMDIAANGMKNLIRVYTSMNCSFVYQEWKLVGKENSNRSYDGVIGFVQRNENDIIAGMMFPTDSFANQPGFAVTTGLPGGAVIVSKKNETQTQRLALLHLWANSFDAITADYVLIVVFLFVAVLSFIVCEKRLDAGRWMANCCSNWWNSTISLIGHGSLDPTEESGRIAVLFFNFFILLAIKGIMLSTFGADLVYEIDPPIIESVDEFTNESYTQPAVIRQLYMLNAAQNAVPGSPIWRLNQVVQSNPNVTIWDLDIHSDVYKLQQQIDHYLNGISDSRSALITAELSYPCSKMIMCTVWSAIAKHMKRSRSFRSSGPAVMLMSYQIDPDLRKVHEHMVSLARQSDYYNTYINNFMRSILMTYTSTPFSVVRDCEMGTTHEPHEYSSFDLETFEPTFRGFAAALALSLIVFMLERKMISCVRMLTWLATKVIPTTRKAIGKLRKLNCQRRRVRKIHACT